MRKRPRHGLPWLSDESYTVVSWLVGTFIPATVTLIGVLGPTFGWQVDQLQTCLSAMAVFLGTCFNIQAPRDGFTGR